MKTVKTEMWLNIAGLDKTHLAGVKGWVASWFADYNGQGPRQFMETAGTVGGKQMVKATSQASPSLKIRTTPSLAGATTGKVLIPGDTVQLINKKDIFTQVADTTPVVTPPVITPPVVTPPVNPPEGGLTPQGKILKALSIAGVVVGGGLLIWAVWPKKKTGKKGKTVGEEAGNDLATWEVMIEGKGPYIYEASSNKDEALGEIANAFDLDLENTRFSITKVKTEAI